jgi:hypothetical protein
MAGRKIELVSFEINNYCTRENDADTFVCDDMHCDSCEHNKPYWLAADGRGIDVEELYEMYEVEKKIEANGRCYAILERKDGDKRKTAVWAMLLAAIFLSLFVASYFFTKEYILK